MGDIWGNMKKNKNKDVEMRIYELLGVKIFRKMAFFLRDSFYALIISKMSPDDRKNYLYHTFSNYNIGNSMDLKKVKAFKKMIYINAGFHLILLCDCFPDVINMIRGIYPFSIITLLPFAINLYCVMLQRYNYIKINKYIEKYNIVNERKKNRIKEELRKGDSLLLDHSYKIVDNNKIEQNITFDKLLEEADIDQLRKYREHLADIQKLNDFYKDEMNDFDNVEMGYNIPLENNKILKLEFINNKN